LDIEIHLVGRLRLDGLILWWCFRLFLTFKKSKVAVDYLKNISIYVLLIIGAVLGLLSGLTGTGGGIFLSPLILFLGWSSTKTTSGITALFILINSSFGLLGNYSSVQNLPTQLPLFIGAALIGALIGTTLGIKFYTANTIKKALALVLVIAGFKLLLT